MAYSEINARRMLAKKLFEAQAARRFARARWHDCTAETMRAYERDIEALFNPNDEEVRDALRVLRWHHDASS